MLTTNFSITGRIITKENCINYAGKYNVDTFQFTFNDENWAELDKTCVFKLKDGTTYNTALLNDATIVPAEVYENASGQVVKMGVYGYAENECILDTIPINIFINDGVYQEGIEPENLPTMTQWDEFVAQANQILSDTEDVYTDTQDVYADTQGVYNDTLGIKADVQEIYDDTSQLKTDVEGLKTDVQGLKTQIENDIADAELDITAFNNNYTEKLNAFNTNATNKTTAYNNNATEKLNAYNTNATDKLNTYNTNASDKTTTFNNNYTEKLNAITSEGGTQVGLVTAEGTTQVGLVNTAGTTQVGLVNSEGATQLALLQAENLHLINQIPQATATTTSGTATISDSSNLNITDAVVFGNATQDGTPTPSSPVDINVVTGDVEVTLQTKNIFDKSLAPNYISGGISKTLDANGDIVISSSTASSNRYAEFRIETGQSLAGKTVRFTGTWQNSASNKGAMVLRVDGSAVKYYTNNNGATQSYTYANDYTGTQVVIDLYANYQGTLAVDDYVTYYNVIITLDYEDMTYVPYQSQTQTLSLGSIELAKVGDYADRIYKSGDSWYLEKIIQPATLTGGSDENWSYNSTYNCFFLRVLDKNQEATTSVKILSNYFNGGVTTTSATQWTDYADNSIGSRGGSTYFGIKATSFTTLDSFTTWLSTHNTNIIYVLATPTTTEITDSTLVSQLNALLELTTYKNVTNVTISNTNATPDIALTYYQDLATLFSNLQNAIISLGGNV